MNKFFLFFFFVIDQKFVSKGEEKLASNPNRIMVIM
jgi:hypothetical protein